MRGADPIFYGFRFSDLGAHLLSIGSAIALHYSCAAHLLGRTHWKQADTILKEWETLYDPQQKSLDGISFF